MQLSMLKYTRLDATEKTVRTTVTNDDELFQRALEVADPAGHSRTQADFRRRALDP
jgi:hypothetical protein